MASEPSASVRTMDVLVRQAEEDLLRKGLDNTPPQTVLLAAMGAHDRGSRERQSQILEAILAVQKTVEAAVNGQARLPVIAADPPNGRMKPWHYAGAGLGGGGILASAVWILDQLFKR